MTHEAKCPEMVEIRHKGYFRAVITVYGVAFQCRVKKDTTTATIEVDYLSEGVALEYRSTAEWIRSQAQSQPWAAEELAAHLAEHLAACIRNHRGYTARTFPKVTARIHFSEADGLLVTVTYTAV